MGPSAMTGKYVRPTTMITTPPSRPAKRGVSVGKVPADGGTGCLRPSEPAIARAGIIRKKRPTSMHNASVVLHWAAILLGLGAGFLLVAAIDRAGGRERRPSPLLPGVVLVLLAGLGALSRRTPVLEVLAGVRNLWPWALVVAGALIVGQALRRGRRA